MGRLHGFKNSIVCSKFRHCMMTGQRKYPFILDIDNDKI